MAPGSALDDAEWTLESGMLYPTRTYMQDLCNYLAARGGDDLSLIFTFPPRYSAAPVTVNVSRLEFAGGPFHALTSHDFSEKLTRQVLLSDADRPPVFSLLRDFLYAKSVRLDGVPFRVLFDTAKAAHRWQLAPLFKGVLAYISAEALLDSPSRLLAFADISELPGVPAETLVHFWYSVGEFFGAFRNPIDVEDLSDQGTNSAILDADQGDILSADGRARESVEENWNASGTVVEGEELGEDGGSIDRESSVEDNDDSISTTVPPDPQSPVRFELKTPAEEGLPTEVRLCPGFPRLWPLAVAQGMVYVVLRSIITHWEICSKDLLDVVLKYIEPRIDDDAEVFALLALLDVDTIWLQDLFESKQTDDECTARAMRLLGKTMFGPAVPRHEMRYAWKVYLSEKQEFVKDFFFSPDNDSILAKEVTEKILSEAIDNGNRRRSRHSKFEVTCETSVRFTLSVGCDPEDEAGIHLFWRPGVVFTYAACRIIVDMEVLDNGCQCCLGREVEQKSYSGMGGCLGRKHMENMGDENGLVSVPLTRALLASYLAVHDEECYVTISLVVRGIREKKAW